MYAINLSYKVYMIDFRSLTDEVLYTLILDYAEYFHVPAQTLSDFSQLLRILPCGYSEN